jgi:hypothetical protein
MSLTRSKKYEKQQVLFSSVLKKKKKKKYERRKRTVQSRSHKLIRPFFTAVLIFFSVICSDTQTAVKNSRHI